MTLACVRQPAKFPEFDALRQSRERLSVTGLLLDHNPHIVHSPPGLQAVKCLSNACTGPPRPNACKLLEEPDWAPFETCISWGQWPLSQHFEHLCAALSPVCRRWGHARSLVAHAERSCLKTWVKDHQQDTMPPNDQSQTTGQSPVSAIQDAVYGTRNYTAGAKYQLPRKVPLRIEPKTYFGEACFTT